MKAQLKIMIILVAAAGFSTHASELGQKEHVNFNFNKEIEKNNNTRTELQKSVTGKMAVESDEDAQADQAKVLNLVDMEMNVGSKERPVAVDRRFNSVGEPVVDKSFNSGSVQLVDDNQQAQQAPAAEGQGT